MSDIITNLDPRTPILVGVGQASDPVTAADYHRWSPVDLAAEASRRALADAGVLGGVVDVVAGVRQFEISTPVAVAPLGRADNFPRAVARRLGTDPQRAVLEVSGGQGPQHLVTEFAKAIARGEADAVLLCGSEAISTTRALAGRPDAPDFSEQVGGQLEDRGYGLEGMSGDYERAHGLLGAPPSYGLFENARRGRLGATSAEYAAAMGELFEPFTRIAASNPYAAAPTARSASELATVTEQNRLIASPYPRFVVSRDQVNQGAALVLMSLEAARAAGVPQDRWIFLHGSCDLRERSLLERPDLSASPAAVQASRTALERAGIGVDDVDTFDLYSCFPIPVFNICDGLGISPTDLRGLTLTGGLPFFGGAGNNYSMHAIAETVGALRDRADGYGFVGANGGVMSKYSVGIYSPDPRPFESWDDATPQGQLDAVPPAVLTRYPTGEARVETFTTVQTPDRTRIGIVVGRLADGSRMLAVTAPDDQDARDFLMSHEPFGAVFRVDTDGTRNRASGFQPA